MEVKRITKKLRLSVDDSIRFQLITALVFLKKEMLTPSELTILTHLVKAKEVELGAFCNETAKAIYVIEKMEDFAVRSQNVRNIVNKLHKRGFISKSAGKGKKTIQLSPDIEMNFEGNVMLDYQFLSINES